MKWKLFIKRTYTPLSLSRNSFRNDPKYINKIVPIKSNGNVAYYNHDCYWPEKDYPTIANYQIKRYKKEGAKFLWMMDGKCLESGEKLLKYIKKSSKKDFSKLNNNELATFFENIVDEFRGFVIFLSLVFVIEKWFEEEIIKILDKRDLDEKEKTEIQKYIIEPYKFNVSQEETISLLKLAVEAKKKGSDKIMDKVKEHQKKFGWLQVRWFKGEPFSVDELMERLKVLIKENPEEKLKELINKPKKVDKEFKELTSKLKLNQEEQEFIKVGKEYLYLRTYRADVINEVNFNLMPMLNKAAEILKIKFDDTIYLSTQEIVESLRKGKLLDNIDIESRKKSWALLKEGENVKIYQGKEVEDFLDREGLRPKELGSVDELKGKSAYKGVVKGKAKVVLSYDDIKKVNKDDILVTTMTFPSYIVAMEKAAAFITDEGGVLCHAAIISREMKKPCIIGTKIATQVLKDGDLVEVNADEGVVRILR